MNKIGFNILPWTAGVSTNTFPILDRLKSIGYDGIEVLIGSPDEKEYKAIAPHLAHVHFSENDRGTPGKGLVHWEEVFTALNDINYQGWYTIEAFSRADPDFANAINVWREYSDPWEIAEYGYHFIKSNLEKFEKK
jgi:sugar phosphate isomerase/epimerase